MILKLFHNKILLKIWDTSSGKMCLILYTLILVKRMTIAFSITVFEIVSFCLAIVFCDFGYGGELYCGWINRLKIRFGTSQNLRSSKSIQSYLIKSYQIAILSLNEIYLLIALARRYFYVFKRKREWLFFVSRCVDGAYNSVYLAVFKFYRGKRAVTAPYVIFGEREREQRVGICEFTISYKYVSGRFSPSYSFIGSILSLL